MWIMTVQGPLSVTQPRGKDNTNMLQIRSRDRNTLNWVRKSMGYDIAGKVVSTPMRDYQFRLFVTKADFAEWMKGQILEINYDNFKDRAGKRFHDMYMSIWYVIFKQYDDFEERMARRRDFGRVNSNTKRRKSGNGNSAGIVETHYTSRITVEDEFYRTDEFTPDRKKWWEEENAD